MCIAIAVLKPIDDGGSNWCDGETDLFLVMLDIFLWC